MLYQHCFFSFSLKAKLSYAPSAAGHVDARCRLIKCLPLQLEFMQVSDIQVASETNSLIEFSLSLKTVFPLRTRFISERSWLHLLSSFFFFFVTCSQNCFCSTGLRDYVICQVQTLFSSCSQHSLPFPSAMLSSMLLSLYSDNCCWKGELEFVGVSYKVSCQIS